MTLCWLIILLLVFPSFVVCQGPSVPLAVEAQIENVNRLLAIMRLQDSQDDADETAIIPGRLIDNVIPKYPKEAREEKAEGEVVLQVTVEANGNVNGIAIASGNLVLAEAAVDAVRTWRFEPYTQHGAPVKILQPVTFSFTSNRKEAELEPLQPASLLTRGMAQVFPKRAGVFAVGPGISPPQAIYSPDPPYDESARKAKYEGVCVLNLIVGTDGQTSDIRVIRALGRGLDTKAVETVSHWKFQPAMKDGSPVAIVINIEINFRLY